MFSARGFFMLLPLAFLGGCAFLPSDAGFGDVGHLVEERSGEVLHWRGVSLEEEALKRLVQDLLADPLTATDAVRLALLNNPDLQGHLEELGIMRADLVRAGILRNPVLTATVQFPEGGGRTNLEFSLVQEFLHIVQLPMRRRVAKQSFEQVKLRTAHAALDLAADVREAFYQVQGTLWQAEIHGWIEDLSEAAADAAERLHRAGNISDLALAQERARYQQARLTHLQAQTRHALAHEELAVLLGLPGSTALQVTPRLPNLPATEIGEAGLEDMALEQRLDLAALRLERTILAERLRGTRLAATQPDLGLGVETERESDGSWLTGPKVRVNLPIFDTGGTAVDGQLGRLRQVLHRETALEVHIRGEVRQAWVQLQAARLEVEHYRQELLPLQERIVEESQLHYNAMQIGLFQLLSTKKHQFEDGLGHVRARQAYWQAHNRLVRALGGLLPEDAPSELDADLDDLFGEQTGLDFKPKPVEPTHHHTH
jgi:outer membrane protein, heavy metal efflux system